MFGLGFGEILFICVIALLVLGPKKLPSAARSLGRTAAQFRHTLDEFHREVRLSDLDLPEQPATQATDERPTEKLDEPCPEDNSPADKKDQ